MEIVFILLFMSLLILIVLALKKISNFNDNQISDKDDFLERKIRKEDSNEKE